MSQSDCSAADLPDGSVVATDIVTYTKHLHSNGQEWQGDEGETAGNQFIDLMIGRGAEVLRVGYDG